MSIAKSGQGVSLAMTLAKVQTRKMCKAMEGQDAASVDIKPDAETTLLFSTVKKSLNVDSPSFTPSFLSPNDALTTKKPAAISPKAASAAPFLPKSLASSAWIAVPSTEAVPQRLI